MHKLVAQNVFDIEIRGLSTVKSKLNDTFDEVVDLIIKSEGRVIVCGLGKSGYIARKIYATLLSTGSKSMYLHPAEALHGDLGMVEPNDVMLAISNSGETEEILKLVAYFKDNQITLISLTGNPDSTLAKLSDFHLDVGVDSEACPHQLAPTASTTASLAMGDALAIALMTARKFLPENFARFHPGGSLGKKLLGYVSNFMKPAVTVDLNADFKDILGAITSAESGIICVTENSFVLGVITDGDIRRCLSNQKIEQVFQMTARDIYSKNPKVISQDAKCTDADEIMKMFGINSLLVINPEGKPFIYQNLNRMPL